MFACINSFNPHSSLQGRYYYHCSYFTGEECSFPRARALAADALRLELQSPSAQQWPETDPLLILLCLIHFTLLHPFTDVHPPGELRTSSLKSELLDTYSGIFSAIGYGTLNF